VFGSSIKADLVGDKIGFSAKKSAAKKPASTKEPSLKNK